MISDKYLRRWSDFLDVQMKEIDDRIIAATGGPFVPTRENVAFLEVDDALLQHRIDSAVDSFIESKTWPLDLTPDQCMHLLHRAFAAREAILAMLSGKLQRNASRLAMPNASDKPKFSRWLLIDLWRVAGPAYLQGLSGRWLADNPP